MKKSTVLLLLLLFPCSVVAQVYKNDANLQKLVKLITNAEWLEKLKENMSPYVEDIDKENFSREYDTALLTYLHDYKVFFSENFTPDEIRQLLQFIKSSSGKKMHEKGILFCSFFEAENRWNDSLEKLKSYILVREFKNK